MGKFTSKQKKRMLIGLWVFLVLGIAGTIGEAASDAASDANNKETLELIAVAIGTLVSIVGGVAIYKLVNFDDSNDELINQRKKKEIEEKKRAKLSIIDSANMVYHGGGLIDRSKNVKVVVTRSGLWYGPHSINKDNIESFKIDTQSQMSTHVKQRVTATRMVLLGPFALAAPKSKTTKVDQVNKFLGIDYIEHGQKYTLILEGGNAVRLELALRKMKSNNNVYE